MVKKFFILTDGVCDGFYSNSRELACGSIQDLTAYRRNLIDSGSKAELVIQQREYKDWGDIARIREVELIHYERKIYTKRSLDMLLKAKTKMTYRVGDAITVLTNCIPVCNDTEVDNINNTIDILKKKIDELVASLISAD